MQRCGVTVRFLLLFILVTGTLFAEAPGVYAIVGGMVHPVSSAPITGGVVIIREGLIEKVGPAGTSVPADATVVDAKGMHVYPGFFDAQTTMGLPAPPRRIPQRPGGPPSPASSEPQLDPSPALIAARQIKLTDDLVDARRATGVTTVLIVPANGIFNGQSAILNLSGTDLNASLIKSPATHQISFNARTDGRFPDSLMGVFAHIRQTFLDEQQLRSANQVYNRNPAGKRRPVSTPDLEALSAIASRTLPVVFMVDSENMMLRALELAKEFNLRPILSGGRQSYLIADQLKSGAIPVLVSVNFPVRPAENPEEQPLRVIRERVRSASGPSVLAKSGVPFALVSGGTLPAGDFMKGIRKAITAGLSKEAALRAITLSPAEIFGVQRQIGSLERGKIANVVISSKEIFEKDAKISSLMVDGRLVRLPKDEPKSDGASTPSPLSGSWSVSVRTSEGEVAMQFVLRGDGSQLSGTFSGQRGSGDIRDGSIEGSSFQFTISARTTETGESGDWKFEGTVDGDTMSGTVSTSTGSLQFSGSKGK